MLLALTGCDGATPAADGGLEPDAALADAATPDASRPDAGPDAFVPVPDAGPGDAGLDGGTDPVADGGPPPLPTECTTSIGSSGFVELCEVEDRPRHVRIQGVLAPPFHASAQVVFGLDTAPAGPNVDLADGQLRVLLYGGSTPAPPPLAQATFGARSRPLGPPATFLHAPSTVCFDVHEGSDEAPPYVVLWLDGHAGADCQDRATLSLESAYGMELAWDGVPGAVTRSRLFFRQSSGLSATPVVTLSRDPALSREEAARGLHCTTSWAENTDWQPLCRPAAGRARHVRIEDAEATANNGYFYLVLGEGPDPSGTPALGPNKLILTGGRSASGLSWTWFRFHEGSTTQFRFPTPDSPTPLYTSGPSTVCLDLGEHEGNLRVVFWATGAGGADCADPTTLTLANALYDGVADPSAAGIWSVPLGDGVDFVKTNNGTVRLGRVVVDTRAAALR